MTPFLEGALGALVALLALGLARRAFWFARLRRWRSGRPALLGRLLSRLGARPEQEAVVRAEAEALAAEVSALRGDLAGARAELADLVAGPALDVAAASVAFDRRLARLAAVRARAAEALARVHAALDPPQREALAALLRRGPRGHRCGRGPGPAHA